MTSNTLGDRLEAHATAITLALEHGLDSIHSELASSRNAVPLKGAEYRSLVTAAGAGARVMSSPGVIAGYAARETSGAAPALIRLHDGADINGDVVMSIALTGGQALQNWFLPRGISLTYGLFVEVVAGAIEGVAYLVQA